MPCLTTVPGHQVTGHPRHGPGMLRRLGPDRRRTGQFRTHGLRPSAENLSDEGGCCALMPIPQRLCMLFQRAFKHLEAFKQSRRGSRLRLVSPRHAIQDDQDDRCPGSRHHLENQAQHVEGRGIESAEMEQGKPIGPEVQPGRQCDHEQRQCLGRSAPGRKQTSGTRLERGIRPPFILVLPSRLILERHGNRAQSPRHSRYDRHKNPWSLCAQFVEVGSIQNAQLAISEGGCLVERRNAAQEEFLAEEISFTMTRHGRAAHVVLGGELDGTPANHEHHIASLSPAQHDRVLRIVPVREQAAKELCLLGIQASQFGSARAGNRIKPHACSSPVDP